MVSAESWLIADVNAQVEDLYTHAHTQTLHYTQLMYSPH